MNEYELKTQYDEFLNEIHGETVMIAGLSYDTATAFKEVDPIAYEVGLSDFETLLEVESEDDE